MSFPSRPIAPRPSKSVIMATLTALVLVVAPIHAQSRSTPKGPATKGAASKATGAKDVPSILGTWSGTATVPLKDSSIVVPVVYTFTQVGDGSAISGTAMVPGQGAGPISDVVRDGMLLKFRVTAPEGRLLEHDGAFTADGAIEGMVNLDKLPVAKFRITPKKG